MIEEGKMVPKFQLQDADGNTIKSSQLKGKKFVVYFYPRDFTPGCTTEADEFSKDYKKFQKAGADRVFLNNFALENPEFIKKISNLFGRQFITNLREVKKIKKKHG